MWDHELKTDAALHDAVRNGTKTFEIRFAGDRVFVIDQILKLRKTRYTGEEMKSGAPLIYEDECETFNYFWRSPIFAKVNYILRGPCYGLAEDWVIMSIEVIRSHGG